MIGSERSMKFAAGRLRDWTRRPRSNELQMTLPGFNAEEVQVTATPSEIVVHAEIKPEQKTDEAKVLWT